MTRRSCIILLDVGGTSLKSALGIAGLGPLNGTVVTGKMPSEGSREEIAEAFSDMLRRQGERAARDGFAVSGIAAAFPGPFDFGAGVFRMKHKFASVYGESFGTLVPSEVPVRFMHDVNAALKGNLMRCGTLGRKALITLGTGLGFSYAVDGVIAVGESGSPARSLYNLPYRDGILEDYASRRAVLANYAALGGDISGIDVADVASRAREGDAAALSAFARMGCDLAEGALPLLRELDISEVILGGQISRSYRFFADELRRIIPQEMGLSVSEDITGSALRGAASLFER